ncbi:MAG: hypothetical protein AB7S48_17120 [Bacteroidales bacterium]
MRRLFILIISAIVFSSCATSKLLTSGLTYNDLTTISILNPIVEIGSIEKGNRAQYDKVISDSSKSIIIQNIKNIFTGKQIDVIALDSLSERELFYNISSALKYIDKTNDIQNVRFNANIDSILSSRKIDYAMIIIATGFTRMGKNYRNQMIVGAFTGMTPIKASCHMRIVIIDRKNNSIAFHRKAFPEGTEPLDSKMINKELTMLFKDYIKK